jgi:hypothetical protein
MEPLEKRIENIMQARVPEEIYVFNQGQRGQPYEPVFSTDPRLEIIYLTGIEDWLNRESIHLKSYKPLLNPVIFAGFSLELALQKESDPSQRDHLQRGKKEYFELFLEYAHDPEMQEKKKWFQKGLYLARSAKRIARNIFAEPQQKQEMQETSPYEDIIKRIPSDQRTPDRMAIWASAYEAVEQLYATTGKNICSVLTFEYGKAIHALEFYVYKGDFRQAFEKLDAGYFFLRMLEYEIEMNDTMLDYSRCKGETDEGSFLTSEAVYAALSRLSVFHNYAHFIHEHMSIWRELRMLFFQKSGLDGIALKEQETYLATRNILQVGDRFIFGSLGDLDNFWKKKK